MVNKEALLFFSIALGLPVLGLVVNLLFRSKR